MRRNALWDTSALWEEPHSSSGLAFYPIVCMKSIAIMKYLVKNNMNYTQDGCGGGYGRA